VSTPTTGYGNQDPRELPAYSVPEAAHYLHLPASTLGSWVSGVSYQTRGGGRRADPVILLLPGKRRLLSFLNLAEAHVLAAIRREHDVSLQRVRKALRFVTREIGVRRPLIDVRFKTDGVDLFVTHYGELINASRQGQAAIKHAIEESLARIDWDEQGLAARLFPFVRGSGADAPRVVVIDPRRAFGRPVIVGTGIATAVLYERWRAGDDIEALADDYRVSSALLQDALRCEFGAAA